MGKEEKAKRKKRKKESRKAERPALWEACKKRFDLTDEEIGKAKDLGITPEHLISLPAVPSEKWKDPPKRRINRLYEKREALNAKRARAKERWERKNAKA